MNARGFAPLRRLLAALMAALMLLAAPAALADITVNAADYPVREDGWYDTMEEVAVYLTEFDALPDNYLTKNEAEALGWQSSRGNLWNVAKGKSIGGDRFGNYEKLLPDEKGRRWTECDIGFDGGYRGGERIVFSNDGLIYYTGDHYASFERVIVVEDEETEEADVEIGETQEEGGFGLGDLIDLFIWLTR